MEESDTDYGVRWTQAKQDQRKPEKEQVNKTA